MTHEITHCVSERKPVGYMIDHAASRAASRSSGRHHTRTGSTRGSSRESGVAPLTPSQHPFADAD
jgi:hypothetical protein